MKKLLVVLTILVLVAGFAFATLSGSVEAKYKFDFLDETATYTMHGKNAKFTFSLSTESATSEGSNKPYATVTVSIAASGDVNKIDADLSYNNGAYEYTIANLFDAWTWKFKLSDFRIVGENWEIDLIKAIGVGDYAKSAWEVDGDDDAIDAPWTFGKDKGITVTYEGYKVGLHLDRNELLATTFNLRAESKEIALAEGVTVQAAAALGYFKEAEADAEIEFGFSVKGAYAADGIAVKGAVDLQKVGENFDADVAAAVEVAPVAIDAYYATTLQADPVYALGEKDDYLSVRAIVDVEKIAENVPVKVTLYGENLINDGRLLGIKEEGKFGKVSEDAQFGIYPSLYRDGDDYGLLWFANASAGYDVAENVTVRGGAGLFDFVEKVDDDKFAFGWYAFNAGADYKHDLFKAAADVYLAKAFATGSDDGDLMASFKATVSSDKLVENAVLSASLVFDEKGAAEAYSFTRTLDEFNTQDAGPDEGTGNYLVLSCKVSF